MAWCADQRHRPAGKQSEKLIVVNDLHHRGLNLGWSFFTRHAIGSRLSP
jgi:hypothetical protein